MEKIFFLSEIWNFCKRKCRLSLQLDKKYIFFMFCSWYILGCGQRRLKKDRFSVTAPGKADAAMPAAADCIVCPERTYREEDYLCKWRKKGG